MTASHLDNKRRLERHSRRDGKGARPALMQRNNEEDRSSVGYIRNFVENANHAGSELSKRLGLFMPDDKGTSGDNNTGTSSDSGTSETSTADDNSSRGAANTRNAVSSASTSATQARTTSLANIFTFQTSTLTTSSTTSSTVEDTFTSSTPTTTSTKSTHTYSTPSSTSSAILTTTEAASSTSSLVPTTSIAFVTSVPTATIDNAASSSTSTVDNAASSSTPTAKSDYNSVGVGPIIGIVAGSLAGIAVIVVIVGFLIKKFGRKEDPYESNPFDRDEFRRHSVMLPDGFDGEEFDPPMSEYNNNGGMFGGGSSEAGFVGAGAAIVGGYAASQTHNDSSRPRPPTMFQKHINGPAAQYSNAEANPQLGSYYNNPEDDFSPRLPPMAFGGSDPYSIAGVERNHDKMDGNVNNPYAHLDRSPSHVMQGNALQAKQYSDEYADMNRHGSQGSSYEQYQVAGNDYESKNSHSYDTAGRPGTSEGRSGTPDLPNVQQTYAVAGVNNDNGQQTERVVSPHHMMTSPEHINCDMYNQGAIQQQQPLQVRNLLPNPHEGDHQRQEERPVSRDSSADNDEAAYGGVW